MISHKKTFFLGIFISIIPFLGLPSSWKVVLVILSGLLLIALSTKVVLPRKPARPRAKKEKVFPKNAFENPSDNIISSNVDNNIEVQDLNISSLPEISGEE